MLGGTGVMGTGVMEAGGALPCPVSGGAPMGPEELGGKGQP